ncbi:1-acyl-sn-glycerol-3-phosphate acyltransferase [Reichenbachiella sp.]|uniref:1-acyl-sn-glycerol-3-phosphate acyltransferase n=1 Tax=Reichenbachiella sp. TaxID=2184521 RepID=UPI003296D2DA
MKFIARSLFILLVLILTGGGVFSLFQIKIGENLNQTLPSSLDNTDVNSWINSNKQSIAFAITCLPNDTPEDLELYADSLIAILNEETDQSIVNLIYRSDLDPEDVATHIYENLPLYLEENDYQKIEQLLSEAAIEQTLISNKHLLVSPEGFGIKKWLIADPLHLLPMALEKLSGKIEQQKFANTQGLFLSRDAKQLYIYGELKHSISDSQQNAKMAAQLGLVSEKWNLANPKHSLSYFGTFLIAEANASQIKKDIAITLSIAILFIIGLLIYYYRAFSILLLFLIPGIFGVLFAIGCIYLIQGELSGLALGASAVVFGIVADYSFHYFSQFKQTKDALEARNQILLPLSTSAFTTILAFLSLLFAQSQTLHDFGLLTALSLSGTLFFVLTALPYLLRPLQTSINFDRTGRLDRWMDTIKIEDSGTSSTMLWFISLMTLLFSYFALDVKFEDDLSKLNHHPKVLKEREMLIQNIDPDREKRIGILVSDTSESITIRVNFNLKKVLDSLAAIGSIHQQFSLAPFLIPESEQKSRIQAWNSFWRIHSDTTKFRLSNIGSDLGFNQQAFRSFFNLLEKDHRTQAKSPLVEQSQSLQRMRLQHDNDTGLMTSIVCDLKQLNEVKSALATINGVQVLDEKNIIGQLIKSVKADFNYLLLFASLAVFVAMFVVYGSVELTLISFIPMLISWIWILGLSSLLDIKFNFINVIIATFIFGLGDDFSIFITDGLQEKYKSGKRVLGHYKAGILLSALSTIVGTGVLIFAKHPALRSIATLSVLGIIIIVFVSFFIQPLLFRFFITARIEKGKPPMTILGMLIGGTNFAGFAIGSLISTVICTLIRWTPMVAASNKKYWTHLVIQKIAQIQLATIVTVKMRDFHLDRLDFDKPSILIANHSTFIDILTLLRLHPKLVLMVNDWVYHSPLFGPIVRYADFLPAFEGAEKNKDKIKELLAQGYSIGIFPEGTRTEEGKIGRFHKGAFYLAKELKVDITPIMLHGFGYTLPKYDFYLKSGFNDLTVLPRIKWNDTSYGEDYRSMTKLVSKAYKQAYQDRLSEPDMAAHAYSPILGSFRYKGPVSDWYFRIKWKYEIKNYEQYNQLIGRGTKKIYDLGCGMGYLSHFLLLRAPEREVIGIDYDEDKITLAANSYLNNERIHFESQDITTVKPVEADAIILADVLHYLSDQNQLTVLQNCLNGLRDKGILLIRDGMSGHKEKHDWTEKSEKWSTRILKFNKTSRKLNFFNLEFIFRWAEEHGMSCEVISQSKKSSNTLVVLKKHG